VIVSPLKSSNPLETPAPVRAPAGVRRKARPDLYTVLLVIALLAVILGIVFLWLYNIDFDWKLKGGPAVAMSGERPPIAGSQVLVAGSPFPNERIRLPIPVAS
jgi:hypothetical protein